MIGAVGVLLVVLQRKRETMLLLQWVSCWLFNKVPERPTVPLVQWVSLLTLFYNQQETRCSNDTMCLAVPAGCSAR